MLGNDESHLSAAAVGVLLANRARFLSFLERRLGSRDLAEEVLQDTMTKALERGGELRDEERTVAWFFRVLRNAVTDAHRRRDAAGRALDRLAQELDASVAPEELTREVCGCVSGVLDTLKPEYQAPLRAVDLEDRPLATFAADTGITQNLASVRLHRARKALAARLMKTCGACAEHGCIDCSCRHEP